VTLLIEKSVSGLLEAFRSPAPTPGGGSASALAGAIGASLVAMVGSLPKPRATTAEDTERLQAAVSRCTALADELAGLVDRDSEAYETVMAAFRLPKNSDDEKRTRAARIQEALRVAIDAPLAVMRACAAAAEQAVVVASLGNLNAASDVQVAIELLTAGLNGARVNVEINVKSVKNVSYVEGIRTQIAELARAAAHEAEAARRHLI
jgi:formiminotetrahydrofolate cyclodeaminase